MDLLDRLNLYFITNIRVDETTPLFCQKRKGWLE